MSYEIGDKVLYKGLVTFITSEEYTHTGSNKAYRIRLPSGLKVHVDERDIIPFKSEVKVVKLIPGGFIEDSGNYMSQVIFGYRIEKNYPQEVIDHWLAWASTNDEEVV